jgi:hypothetical protein
VLERGARAVAERLVPYRNAIVQLWNEDSTAWERLHRAVKAADPVRLVTSSPGFSSVLGTDEHNRAMDVLTPHTVRRSAERPFWEVAPEQVGGLIERFGKPVIDDEPARSGPTQFGGIEGGTKYDSPLTPPSGIPEPDWSPFHRVVFEHLRRTNPAGV